MDDAKPQETKKSRAIPLHWKILTGLVVGAVLGLLLSALAGPEGPYREWLEGIVRQVIHPVGKLFLRLLFMAVVPLVFSSLSLGVFRLGDLRRLGRIGMKTLVATLILSGISVVIGLLLVNMAEPGKGISQEVQDRILEESQKSAEGDTPTLETIIQIVPDTVSAAIKLFEGHVLAVMFLAVVFGAGLAVIRTDGTSLLVRATEGLYDLSMWVIGFAMCFAPIGVAALSFTLMARLGMGALVALGKYVLVVIAGLLIQQFLVYSAVLRAACHLSPWQFFRRISLAMVTAFSTSSSNATLPTTLRVSRERLGVAPEIGNFVLTLGSTFNQNGTALFEGITVLFIAQLYGVDLSLGSQFVVVLLSILAGVGTAGVPGGSIPLIVPVLVMVGVPKEGIGIIIGVDRILDMCRTVLNVTGDLVVTTFIARTEGFTGFPPESPNPGAGDRQT